MRFSLIAKGFLATITHASGSFAFSEVARASGPEQPPSQPANPGMLTSHGCYSDKGNLTTVKNVPILSSGSCAEACNSGNFYVMATHGSECLCGFAYPPEDHIADDEKCNNPCEGYPLEACGGIPSYYSVYNTGLKVDVPNYGEDESDDAKTTSTHVLSTTSTEAPDPEATSTGLAPSTSSGTSESSPSTTAVSPTTADTPAPSTTTSGAASQTPSPGDGSANFDYARIMCGVVAAVAAAVAGTAIF